MIDTMHNCRPITVLLLFSLFSLIPLSSFGAPSPPSASLVTFDASCELDLTWVNGWTNLVPKYNDEHPAPMLPQARMHHRVEGFTTFSDDGLYVLIHHSFYPNGAQISVRRVDDGSLIGTFLWKNSAHVDSGILSAQWSADSPELQVLVGGKNVSPSPAEVYQWKQTGNAKRLEPWKLPPFDSRRLETVPRLPISSFTRISPIGSKHPYIFQVKYVEMSGEGETARFQARVHNWKTGRTLTLADVSPSVGSIVDSEEVFHAPSQVLAIPSRDGLKVNLMTFHDLEEELNKPAELLAQFGKPVEFKYTAHLALTQPLVSMKFVKWAPLLITQTEEGLQLWHVQQATMMTAIPEGGEGDYEVFEQMGVIAIALTDSQLGLYSIPQRKFIATIPQFGRLKIARQIDHWEKGSAYLTDNKGHVFHLRETIQDSKTEYSLMDTGLEHPSLSTSRYRTFIRTATDTYLVSLSDLDRSDLPWNGPNEHDVIMRAFSLTSRQLVGEFEFHLGDSSSQYVLDPTRTRLFITTDRENTGMFKLEEFLEAQGF